METNFVLGSRIRNKKGKLRYSNDMAWVALYCDMVRFMSDRHRYLACIVELTADTSAQLMCTIPHGSGVDILQGQRGQGRRGWRGLGLGV